MDLTFSDQITIVTTVASIGAGVIIYFLTKRDSKKVSKSIVETKVRNDSKKTYYLHRINGHTQIIRNELLSFSGIYQKHTDEPTPRSWQNIVSIAERNKKQLGALWLVIQHDLGNIKDLVHNQYLVDKYWDVNIYLTGWTYDYSTQIMYHDTQALRDAEKVVADQLQKLQRTLSIIEEENRDN